MRRSELGGRDPNDAEVWRSATEGADGVTKLLLFCLL